MGIEIDLLFVMGRKWLGYRVKIEIVLVYVWDRLWPDFGEGIEIDLVVVWGWEICSVGIEINLFLVSRRHNWLDFIAGIEIRLTWV